MCLTPYVTRRYISLEGVAKPIFDKTFFVNRIAPKMQAYKKRGMPFFAYKEGFVEVPCGHCVECSQSYTRQWQIRICKESEKHAENCFITLTYDPEFYPGHLVKKDLSKFVKAVRNKYRNTLRVRFYGCGEYGKKTCRAHYHIILFGYKPHDLVPFFKDKKGYTTYLSQEVRDLWKKGNITVQDLNEDTAAYCAKYLHKVKPAKTQAEIDYPPFSLMSRRPGIGIDCITEQEIEQGYIRYKKYKAALPMAVKRKKCKADLWYKILNDFKTAKRQKEQQKELFARVEKNRLAVEKLVNRDRVFHDRI